MHTGPLPRAVVGALPSPRTRITRITFPCSVDPSPSRDRRCPHARVLASEAQHLGPGSAAWSRCRAHYGHIMRSCGKLGHRRLGWPGRAKVAGRHDRLAAAAAATAAPAWSIKAGRCVLRWECQQQEAGRARAGGEQRWLGGKQCVFVVRANGRTLLATGSCGATPSWGLLPT